MITFTALSGGAGLDSSSAAASSAFCYLLQLDNVSILLDCGIASPDDRSDSHPLAKLASTVDLVLFSHPDAAHTGLYPYARTHWNLLAPAYATLPVQSLAKVALDDECEGEGREAFDAISPLRFTQPSHLQGKCTGLTITPFNAGHSLGGTLWKIRSPSAGTILYAVQLNHLKERTLDGTVLLKSSGAGGGIQVFEPLARPDLLITDAARTLAPPTRRKDRESRLLDVISSTLGSRHSILIPTALGSRLLELLLLLDQHWEFARLRYPLCMVAKNGKEMLDVVRSLMEWFGGKVGEGVVAGGGVGEALSAATSAATGHKRKRDDEKDSPLRFRHLEFFPSPAALVQRYSSRDPKLILAAPLSMATGPSRSIFAELGLANGDGNVVILTQNGAGESVTPSGESLRSLWLNGQDADVKGGQKSNVGQPVRLSGPLTLKMSSKEPLTGAELEEHTAAEKAKAEAAQALERENIMLQADVESSDSDSESDGDSSEEEDEPTVNGDDDTRMSSPAEDLGPMAEPGGGHPLSRRKSKRTKEEMAYMKMQMALDDENLAGFTGTGTRVQNFDTYLKDAGSRNRSFFKSALLNEQANANQGPGQQSGGKTRFKMFPFYERRRKADPYGEEIDIGTWLRRGKELEDQQNQVEDEEPSVDSVVTKGGAKKPQAEPPMKTVTHTVDIQLACSVMFIDMEGLNDGRAVKTIVPQIHPRKMILVHSPNDATKALVESCSQIKTMTRDVYHPNDGETVTIGQQTKSFAISLSESLLTDLKMSQFEDNEVGHVRGRVVSYENSSIPVLEPVLPGSAVEPVSTQSLPQSTLIGDLKLTLLKSRLAALGINADFAGGGVLVCSSANANGNGMDVDGAESAFSSVVAVKKSGGNHVLVEGMPSDVYYKVRKEIYGLYAVVGV